MIDPEARLREALTHWRRTRSPELSALITRLEDSAGAPVLEELPTTQRARALELAELARTSTDANRGRVLEAFKVFAANALTSNVWPALQAWPEVEADPRVCAFAFDLLERPAAVRERTHKLVRHLLGCIEIHGDASACARLDDWGKRQHQPSWVSRAQRVNAALKKKPVVALAPGLLDQLSAGLPAPAAPRPAKTLDGDALLAAIYGAPEDDAPRLAYADWLTERGDARGEFIVLQINRANGRVKPEARAREKVLLAQNRVALLGALAPHVVLSSVRFERGFLSRGELRATTPDTRELALMEELHFGDLDEGPTVPYRALRTARGVAPLLLGQLLESAPRLASAEVRHARWSELAAVFAKARRSLETLVLSCDELPMTLLPAVLATPIAAQLESLTVRSMNRTWQTDPNQPVVPLLAPAALAGAPATLTEVCIEWPQVPLTLRLLRRGERFAEAKVECPGGSTFTATRFAAGILAGHLGQPLDLLEVHSGGALSEPDFQRLIRDVRAGAREVRLSDRTGAP